MGIKRRVMATCGAFALLTMGAGLSTSCSKKKDSKSSEDSSITVAGQLSLTGESTSFNLANPALTDLDVYCVTFQIPPVAGTGEVGEDGAFELTLEATDASIGCFILKDTDVLGTIVFQDPSETDLSGEGKTDDRLALNGGRSDFGAITLDLSTGKAVVDVSKIVTTGGGLKDTKAVAASAFDFTGQYKATSAGIDLPKGYEGICEEGQGGGGDECRGPREGEDLWLKLIKGVEPGTTTAKHAMMIWPNEDSFKACGSKLGFTYEQGKEKGGVDFTDSGVDDGEFDWADGYADGWKKEGATARWSMMKMDNVDDFKGYPGTKQYFKRYRTFSCTPGQPCDPRSSETVVTADGFQFNANTKETGCKDPDGKPYRLDDWSSMSCEFEALSGASAGLQKNVCSKTVDSKKITCTNIGGTFNASGEPIQNAMTRYPEDYYVYASGAFCDYNNNTVFDGNEWPMGGGDGMSCNNGKQITNGQTCASIDATTDGGKLAQLRCYAEALHGNHGGESSECVRDVRGNWSAKTPEDFIPKADGPVKAQNEYVFDLFKFDSETSGSLRSEERHFSGIQVGDNWTDCEVQEVFSLSVRKFGDSNDLLVEMVSNERNVSTKPACITEYGEGKTKKYMFKLAKQ